MKVLYLGHYRELGGWSQAARDYMLAMDSVGIDVVCRNIRLTHKNSDVPTKIAQMESKNLDDCDVCIQHVLPHYLIGTKQFKKNIAYFVSESVSIKPTPWFIHLRQMDEVWVPNHSLRNGLVQDGLMSEDRISVVPHAFDLKKYSKKYKPISIDNANSKFKFYYVGDLNDRKNLPSLIRSFHSEFDRSEPVALILKVWKFGLSPQAAHAAVVELCSRVKTEMRLYASEDSYHREIIIADFIDDEGISSIHQYSDCFVCPSHGEAWSIPSFDAMCFGKTPICSDCGGPKDFIGTDQSVGSLVSGTNAICNCSDSAFPHIFTGREEWLQPSEGEIKKSMRYYYENRDKIDRTAGLKRGKDFSYEKIGNQIKELLEA